MCSHSPECPAIDQPGWDTAAMLVHHDDLGWTMLCNGAIVLDAAAQPAPTPMPAVTEMPVRARRTRTRTRTRSTPATSRQQTTQPIAA